MKLFQLMRNWWKSMFKKSTVEEALKIKIAISDEMHKAIELWYSMFYGKAYWNNDDVPSLRLAKGITTDIARTVTIEFKSEIKGSKRADWLNEQYKRVVDDIRSTTEKGCMGGSFILKPFVFNNEIYVTVVESNCYYPVKYNQLGKLTSVIFTEKIVKEEKRYTLIEYCEHKDTIYTILYFAFVSDNMNDLGKPIPLSKVDEWAHLQESYEFHNVDKPLFAVFNMPQLNSVEQNSLMGAAIYSDAVELIKEADKQFGRALWEFEGGELAINASSDLFKRERNRDEDIFILPKGKERLYRALDAPSEETLLQTFSPAFRDSSIYSGLNEILRKIEFVCGFSYGIISDPNDIAKTATEIKISKQRFYSTVQDIQKALQKTLSDTISAMDNLATIYNLAPIGDYEVSFDWDDSVVSDRDAEFKEKLELLTRGIISPAELRSWYMGTTIEQAQEELPEMTKVID